MAEALVRGLRAHYQILGTEPIRAVFVHGLVLDNLSSFYFTLATPVAQDCGVLLYDLRGHGLTERPDAGYAVADFVADLAALLAQLGVTEPVHLVGNSFGGLLVQAFAVAHPAAVKSLVLVDSHLANEGWGDRMAATLSMDGEERDRKIAETFKEWAGRSSQRKSKKLADTAASLVRATSLVTDLKREPVIPDAALAALGCPILALYGAGSEIRAYGEHLAALSPRVDLRIVEGASHLVLFEATEALREHVRSWIRANGG